MVKRIISFILATILVFSCMSAGFVSVNAANDSTMTTLVKLIKQFPHGKYWNHEGSSKNDPDSVTSTPCSCHNYYCDYWGGCSCNSYDGAIQCMGYAAYISYKITGVDRNDYEESYTLDVSKLRVGDIIRYSWHSVCVTGVKGNKISFTDCNYGDSCVIRWMTVDASYFSYVDYVLHLKGNDRTNTDVNFHDAYKTGSNDPVVPDDDEEDDTETSKPDDTKPDSPKPDNNTPSLKDDGSEIWQMDDDSNLNIRKSAKTSAEKVGSIPAGAKFNVYEKTYDGEHLWGRVSYGDYEGYSALNYSTHISGSYEVPKLTNVKSKYYTNDGISLTWKKVSGADKYKVYIYNKDKKELGTYTTKNAKYTIKDRDAATYYVKVTAVNSVAKSWVMESDMVKVTLAMSQVKPEKISVKSSANLEAGKSTTLKVTYEPSNTTLKSVSWKSSNTKVATVDSNGVVKAVAPGSAVITCTSKEDSKVTAKCKVTVVPSKPVIKQIKSGSSENTIALKWSKSKGADGYIIYRYDSKNKKNVEIAKTTKTSYTVKNLKTATSYVYVVKAYAKTSSSTLHSDVSKVKTVTAPSAIADFKQVTSSTGTLTLQWKKIPTADVYVIYKYDTKKKTYVKIGTAEKNYYVVKTTPSTSAKYRVMAASEVSDGYIFGEPSVAIKAVAGPSAPKAKATATKTTVKLSWGKVAGATSYDIYKLENGKKVKVKAVSATTTSYTISGLKSNKSYTYYVRAKRRLSSTAVLKSDFTTVKVKTTKS